jgi:hypothetical protein
MLTDMRRLYAATFRQMAESAVPEATQEAEEFREQRRRKRVPSGENSQALQVKKSSSTAPQMAPPQVQTWNFNAPLRNRMEVEERQGNSSKDAGDQATSQAGRPPSIILTAATNLLQLQKKLRAFVKGSFEFRNTRNGTRVVTKELSVFSAIKAFFQKKNLSFYTFHSKSLKPIKAVIRHLPSLTPTEEIYEVLEELGFDIISVKQMTSNRRRLHESGTNPTNHSLPLFLITLPRNEKSQQIFKLTGLCHISTKVEAYRSTNNLTQCHNCQQFGHPPPPLVV